LEQSELGRDGVIQIKCNSLDDAEISEYLDIAASNDCYINLIVRGICTWIPSKENLNRNVTIKSIVWDKLEHSRVYCFGKINPTIYMGSLDLITNKLDCRIESLVKITDKNILTILCNYISRYNTIDKSWYMVYEDEKISYRKMKG
jgi:polyphosphate kinase